MYRLRHGVPQFSPPALFLDGREKGRGAQSRERAGRLAAFDQRAARLMPMPSLSAREQALKDEGRPAGNPEPLLEIVSGEAIRRAPN
jgi:hypothetical protein